MSIKENGKGVTWRDYRTHEGAVLKAESLNDGFRWTESLPKEDWYVDDREMPLGGFKGASK